jgi:hypothetical protein
VDELLHAIAGESGNAANYKKIVSCFLEQGLLPDPDDQGSFEYLAYIMLKKKEVADIAISIWNRLDVDTIVQSWDKNSKGWPHYHSLLLFYVATRNTQPAGMVYRDCALGFVPAYILQPLEVATIHGQVETAHALLMEYANHEASHGRIQYVALIKTAIERGYNHAMEAILAHVGPSIVTQNPELIRTITRHRMHLSRSLLAMGILDGFPRFQRLAIAVVQLNRNDARAFMEALAHCPVDLDKALVPLNSRKSTQGSSAMITGSWRQSLYMATYKYSKEF